MENVFLIVAHYVSCVAQHKTSQMSSFWERTFGMMVVVVMMMRRRRRIWGSLQVDGLHAHKWSTLPSVFETIATIGDRQPVLVRADGQWTSLLSQWPQPLISMTVDFLHHT